MARTPNLNTPPPSSAGATEAERLAAEETTRQAAEQAARVVKADSELAAATALSQAPTSAQLEPTATTRTRRVERVVEERVAVRSEPIGLGAALSPIAPLFPAKARVLPSGEIVESRPAEAIEGERREVLIVSRVLHDNVDYSPMTKPKVTRAQFEALRAAGATGETLWEQLN